MKGVSEGTVLHLGLSTAHSYKETFGYQNGRPRMDGQITIEYSRDIKDGHLHEQFQISYPTLYFEGIMPLIKSDTHTNIILWDSEKGLVEPKQKELNATDLDERVLRCIAETPYKVRQCLAKFVNGYRA